MKKTSGWTPAARRRQSKRIKFALMQKRKSIAMKKWHAQNKAKGGVHPPTGRPYLGTEAMFKGHPFLDQTGFREDKPAQPKPDKMNPLSVSTIMLSLAITRLVDTAVENYMAKRGLTSLRSKAEEPVLNGGKGKGSRGFNTVWHLNRFPHLHNGH